MMHKIKATQAGKPAMNPLLLNLTADLNAAIMFLKDSETGLI